MRSDLKQVARSKQRAWKARTWRILVDLGAESELPPIRLQKLPPKLMYAFCPYLWFEVERGLKPWLRKQPQNKEALEVSALD